MTQSQGGSSAGESIATSDFELGKDWGLFLAWASRLGPCPHLIYRANLGRARRWARKRNKDFQSRTDQDIPGMVRVWVFPKGVLESLRAERARYFARS